MPILLYQIANIFAGRADLLPAQLASAATHEVEEVHSVALLELNLLVVLFLHEVLVYLDGNHLWLEHLVKLDEFCQCQRVCFSVDALLLYLLPTATSAKLPTVIFLCLYLKTIFNPS